MHFPFFSKKDQPTSKKNKSQTNSKQEKEQFYPVCPNCLYPDLKFVHEYTSGWLTAPNYYCPNCHYSGLLTLEIDIKLLETKTPEELKKMFLEEEFEQVDNNTGSTSDTNQDEDSLS